MNFNLGQYSGVDSQYFEIYDDPPEDVTSVDLDTSTISQSKVRKAVKLGMLPRKPARVLRAALEQLHSNVHQQDFRLHNVSLLSLPGSVIQGLDFSLSSINQQWNYTRFSVNAMRRSTDFIPIEVDYQIHRRRRMLEMEVQEAFLRFNCCILKGCFISIAEQLFDKCDISDYAHFLKPMRRMPGNNATDAHQLFNIEGKLLSMPWLLFSC